MVSSVPHATNAFDIDPEYPSFNSTSFGGFTLLIVEISRIASFPTVHKTKVFSASSEVKGESE